MKLSSLFFAGLLSALTLKVEGVVKVVDLSGVDFKIQDGDLAFDTFLPQPEECQAIVDGSCKDFSTLLAGKTPEDNIIIPCGECVTMRSYTNGERVEVGMIDVIGLLDFPKTTKMTLVTTGIVVQGKLSMEQDQPINGTPSIVIELKGTDDLVWAPTLVNEDSCIDYNSNVENCRIGKRSFVVAGGTVDIKGFPKAECPTWTRLADTVKRPPIFIENYPKPTTPKDSCGLVIFEEDFSQGFGEWKASVGAVGTLETVDSFDGTQYMKVSKRNRQWQGITMDVTWADWIKCLEPDTPYLLKVTARLTSNNREQSVCSAVGQKCLSFRSHTLYDNTQLTWKTLYSVPENGYVPDGEWATYAATIQFTEKEITDMNTYNTLYFSGPEEGIDISINSFSLRLPDEKFYHKKPDQQIDPFDSVCNSLIVNGDAEADDYFYFPHYARGSLGAYLSVKTETAQNQTNNYFQLRGRDANWASLETLLLTDCIEAFSVYKFSAKVRIHSFVKDKIRMTLKTKVNTTNNVGTEAFKVENVGYCPEADMDTGWVYCEANFMFTNEHVGAEYMQLLFVSDKDEDSNVDYDDISVTLVYTPARAIVINEVDVDQCWDVGAEAIVTSHTILPEDTQLIKITEITTDYNLGTTTIAFNSTIPAHTTLKDSEDYAVEVALLSRNIQIKPQDNVDILNAEDGGHFMVLHTPNQLQLIEGVEFLRMGQQGILGRYPVHFHMSENGYGSIVSKNTVRDSNQRCYVLHGTHNVTLDSNIAYNTFGHCFMVEDGFEQNNTFSYNLGAMTKAMPIHSLLSIAESDHFASTFWISNPNNHFIGNVCAGGEDTGFWYEFLTIVRGPSVEYDPDYKINPSEFLFGSFVGNVIHSYKGDGFKLYPNGYFPKEHAPFTDMISYRNAGDGVLLHNSAKLHIKGGLFADNRVQVEVDKQADDVWVTDCRVVGYSELFRKEVEASNTKSHCPASRPNVGVQLHSYLRYRNSRGYILRNITFEQFGENITGCMGSVGIDLDPESRDGHFDAYSSFQDLHFPPNTPSSTKLSLCKNEEVSGLKDVIFEDWTGDLNPNQDGPGAVVSRYGVMDAFIDNCVEMEGSCAKYCPGGCYRGINFASSQAMEYLDWSIQAISNESGKKVDFKGYFDNNTRLDFDSCHVNPITGEKTNCDTKEDHYNNYIYQRRRYYTATLPKGDYTLQFVDGNGEIGWPTFIEMQWEDNITCPTGINDDTVKLNIPTPTDDECGQIIRNNGGEENSVNHWMHAGGDIKIVEGGYDSQYAISSVERTGAWQGPGQYLDSRCFNVGEYYEVTARVKLVDEATGKDVSCDPHQKHYMAPDVCPRIAFRLREIMGNSIGDEVVTTFVYPVAETLGPYKVNEWNLMYGLLKITEHIAKQTTIFMYVERAAPGVAIVIDDVRMGRTVAGSSHFSYNRDFETGDTRFWHTHGPSDIDIVDAGYGRTGYALKSFNREFPWTSMEQEMNQDLLELGQTYAVKAKVRLEKDGSPWVCKPGVSWGIIGEELDVCPTLGIRLAVFNETYSNYTDIGIVAGEWDVNGWNDMYGVFDVTQEILDAPAVTIIWTKLHESIDLIVDDIEISEVSPPSCDDLIVNGGAEYDDTAPLYWRMFGVSSVDLAPNMGVGNSNAIINSDRVGENDGIRQMINYDCVEPGAVYEVLAWVKLVDDNGVGVDCDVSKTYGFRCPVLNIGAQNPFGAPQQRFVGSPVTTWNKDDFNLLKGYFKFFTNELNSDALFLSVTKVDPSVTLLVDDVSMKMVMGLNETLSGLENATRDEATY